VDALAQVLFVAVGAAFFFLGGRNLLWNEARELQRFRDIVSRGLAIVMAESGIRNVLFGGLLAYASRPVPYSISWQVLGLAIVVLGAAVFAVARFNAPATPSLEQMPEGELLGKRVRARQLSGALYTLGGVIWVWNGHAVLS
jgi:uncharacterized membrane protein